MSEPQFSNIIDGKLGTMAAVKISDGRFSRRHTLVDLTGSEDAAPIFAANCQYLYAFSGTGWFASDATTYANLCGLAATDGTSNPATRFGRVTVVKRLMSLTDVTAGGDAAGTRYFVPGRAMYYGQAARFQQDTEKPFEAAMTVATLTIPLGMSKTIACAAIWESVATSVSMRTGGAVPVSTPFRLTGAPTITEGTPFEAGTLAADIRLDNGRKATGTVILNQISMTMDYSAQGKVSVGFAGVFHGLVTWGAVA